MKCEKELALLREAIRNERKDKRITQEELAEMLEVSPTHVKHIESGHRKPSIEILFEITKILNISLDGVVFSKNESARTDTRKKVDRLLDVSDEASLHFILSVLEALREKEQAGVRSPSSCHVPCNGAANQHSFFVSCVFLLRWGCGNP